jgi:hypothetical protein
MDFEWWRISHSLTLIILSAGETFESIAIHPSIFCDGGTGQTLTPSFGFLSHFFLQFSHVLIIVTYFEIL